MVDGSYDGQSQYSYTLYRVANLLALTSE